MKYFEEHPIVKKAMNEIHDRIPINLIGIHGKLYDPKLFVHPGGTGFIEMCMGCDCSTLFETHHLNKHLADKMLLTLPIVGEYEIQYKYDWNKYANIRSSVFKLFPTRNSREMNFVTKVTLITYVIITFMLHLILLNTIPNFGIWYFFICLSSSFANSIMGAFGHNGIHKMSVSSILLDWNGLSCYEWLYEHVHSHHMYVNTNKDHDAISMMPFLNWIPNKKSLFSAYGKHFVYMIGEIVVVIQGNFVHMVRWKVLKNKKFPIHIRFAPTLFIIRWISHVYMQGVLLGTCSLLICLMFAGYYFTALAHLNHANPHINYTENTHNRHNDFLIHQLTNTININTQFSHLVLYLDRQVLHHLFPTIDHSQLSKIEILKHRHKTMYFLNTRVNETLNKYSISM